MNPYGYVHNPLGWVDPLGLAEYIVTKEMVDHSNLGDWVDANSMPPRDRKTFPNGRLKSGGHGQAAISELEARGIAYNIEKTFPNGVRVGNIPSHASKAKRTGSNQSWFPENWTDVDIKNAGVAIMNSPSSKTEPLASGGTMTSGTHNGVFIRVVIDPKGGGSIFPDNTIQ